MLMAASHWSELSLLVLDVQIQTILESTPESLLRKTGFWQILMLANARINSNVMLKLEYCLKFPVMQDFPIENV